MTVQSWPVIIMILSCTDFQECATKTLTLTRYTGDEEEMRRCGAWPSRGFLTFLTPAHVILTSIRNNNHPDPEIFTAPCLCVCKLTISSGPSETNSRSRETRDWSLMSCVECGQRLNNWLRSILVTPGLMPRLVKMLKYTVFWYFTNIPPRGSILPQLIRGAEAGTESQIFTKLKLDTVHTPAQANDSNDDNDSNDQSA